MQIAAGNQLIVLCSDSTVWTCGGSNTLAQNLGYAATGNDYLSLHQLTTLSGIKLIAGDINRVSNLAHAVAAARRVVD